MATPSKPVENALKEKLNALECPFTVDVEDSWISELIFKPGEQRIRLLQWLFSKFDSRLSDILDPRFASFESKMDSRIQRLLFVASSLGFCKYDDVDLIRGVNTKPHRQTMFIEQIIDAVSIMDCAEDPGHKIFSSPGMVSNETNLDQQTVLDCNYLDTLLRQDKMNSMFNSRVALLPPDIQRNVDVSGNLQGNVKDKTQKTDIHALKDVSEKIAQDLQRQKEILQDLVETHSFQETDESKMEMISKTMSLVLSELHQLVTSFSYCYENEMYHWCNKTAPDLSQLGPTFKRVHTLLQQFVNLLDGFKSIRSSYTNLTRDAEKRVKHIMSKNKQVTGLSQASESALLSFQDCVGVLDESIQRRELDCTTSSIRSTTSTLKSYK